MNYLVWWAYRIALLRWWTGCGGEGYYRRTLSTLR